MSSILSSDWLVAYRRNLARNASSAGILHEGPDFAGTNLGGLVVAMNAAHVADVLTLMLMKFSAAHSLGAVKMILELLLTNI